MKLPLLFHNEQLMKTNTHNLPLPRKKKGTFIVSGTHLKCLLLNYEVYIAQRQY